MNIEGHILTDFSTALESVKGQTSQMFEQAIGNLSNSIEALAKQDDTLCDQVIREDDSMDLLLSRIDKECVHIMTRYRPFAGDLRFVISSMKIAQSLERISDHAENIARRVKKITTLNVGEEIDSVSKLSQEIFKLLKHARISYLEGDLERALKVLDKSHKYHQIQKKLSKKLMQLIDEGTGDYKVYLNLIFIYRCLEGVGDYTTHIAEAVVFMESSQDVRK